MMDGLAKMINKKKLVELKKRDSIRTISERYIESRNTGPLQKNTVKGSGKNDSTRKKL